MQVVIVDDIAIHADVTGPEDGPTVVFSNSLGTDFRTWDAVVAALADRFRCVRYDMRGHGLTELGDAPVTIPRLAADLDGLLRALGVERPVLCGLSIGGLIAQQLVRDRPDAVRGLVLCDTAAKIGTPDMWEARIGAIREGGIDGMAEAILERWFAPVFHRTRAEELRVWRSMLVRTPVDGYLGACAAIRDADLTAEAGRIAVPTLAVCGRDDGATPPDVVRALAQSIPGARYVEIADAGHLPCVEQPAVLADHLRSFIEQLGEGTRHG